MEDRGRKRELVSKLYKVASFRVFVLRRFAKCSRLTKLAEKGENEIDEQIVGEIYHISHWSIGPHYSRYARRVPHRNLWVFLQFATVIARLNLLMPHETITDRIGNSLKFETTKLRQLTVVREWGLDYSLQALQKIYYQKLSRMLTLSLFQFEDCENRVFV